MNPMKHTHFHTHLLLVAALLCTATTAWAVDSPPTEDDTTASPEQTSPEQTSPAQTPPKQTPPKQTPPEQTAPQQPTIVDVLRARGDAGQEQSPTGERTRAFRNQQSMDGRAQRSGVAEAVYQRPFVVGGQRAALGGYVEAAGTWTKEEGVIEGTNFTLPRFNLFVYARILPRVEFISELEFENGGQDIKIETAQLDFALTDWLALRAGVLLIPLGGFNQDHDSPRWPLVDRPLVSETILPATLSEIGLGLHGEYGWGDFHLNGQLYVSNGLGSGIVANQTGRVDISSGKHPALLDFDNNGQPAVSGRLAAIYGSHLEVGVSAYHGAYNQWMRDGERVDDRRTVTLGALELRADIWRFELRGELAMAWVQVPEHSRDIYASKQLGWHLDLYTDLWRHTLGTGTRGRLRAILRAEQADYFRGTFQNGLQAGDTITGVTAGLAWQLDDQLVIRSGVRQRWTKDILNNPAAREVQVQLGVASYF